MQSNVRSSSSRTGFSKSFNKKGYVDPSTRPMSFKDKQWVETLLQKGTITDKISGLTLLGQTAKNDPEGVKAIQTLISMMKRTDRRISGMAMRSLLQLFQTTLLPRDKELSESDPKNIPIKDLYTSFIREVVERAKDNVLHAKEYAIKTLSEMVLIPEQRKTTLPELINKLGDQVRSAAALTSHVTIVLSKRRPQLRLQILEEIERLMYRPNISQRAQFYGIVVLNGFNLNPEHDSDLADRMLKLYFSLFTDIFIPHVWKWRGDGL